MWYVELPVETYNEVERIALPLKGVFFSMPLDGTEKTPGLFSRLPGLEVSHDC